MTESPAVVSYGSCQKTCGCLVSPKPTGSGTLASIQIGLGSSGPGVTGCVPISPGHSSRSEMDNHDAVCRRKCGCMRTSDKLKQILQTFPQPPAAIQTYIAGKFDKACGYGYGHSEKNSFTKQPTEERSDGVGGKDCCPSGLDVVPVKAKMDQCPRCMHHRRRLPQAAGEGDPNQAFDKTSSKSWQVVSELVSLVQLSVTATALALYYLIYCYMQLVYYTLRSALYFHNADGPMKITIGVVTLTSLIVGFNILMRMEGIIGIVY